MFFLKFHLWSAFVCFFWNFIFGQHSCVMERAIFLQNSDVFAQPSRRLGRVRSFSLWWDVHFDGRGDLVQRFWHGEFLEKFCTGSFIRALYNRGVVFKKMPISFLHRSCQQTLLEDLLIITILFKKILPGHLLWRSCTKKLQKNMRRSCQGVSYINLAKRANQTVSKPWPAWAVFARTPK